MLFKFLSLVKTVQCDIFEQGHEKISATITNFKVKLYSLPFDKCHFKGGAPGNDSQIL
jgi:hypothetical protein